MQNQLTAAELSRQLKTPTGEAGLEVAAMLNESNRSLYDLSWSLLEYNAGAHLLEIGFGNGLHFSRYFERKEDITLTGIDISSDMCKAAEESFSGLIEEGKLHIYHAGSSNMPLPDGVFDRVIAINVIYFWDKPSADLSEIRRVLKPDGKLLIGYRPRHTVEHLEFTKQNFTLYEPDELHALLKESGFGMVRDENRTYQKKAPDGTPLRITDRCLLAAR